MEEQFDIQKTFNEIVEKEKTVSLPVVAVKVLTEFIKQGKTSTLQEFMKNLQNASETLKALNPISVSAGCDLFLRFITRTTHDVTNLELCKKHIVEKGEQFIEQSQIRRHNIAELGVQFIKDDSTILIHSYSRVVMLLLLNASKAKKRFRVYVTEARPSTNGQRAVDELNEANIPAKLILDAAVGFIIGKVDMVMVGAEGVVENGGIINQIGTYQIAVVAKAANKPFYAVTESYKFVRIFPLNQYDVVSSTLDSNNHEPNEISLEKQTVDYTPPEYISLLFTDLGVLTPSGVSDELIKWYY
ncbi:IF-2B-domain-containing protein [Piromyces finnis]|uniref:Translation initiation factor eIF2B subunit alpha n=1 Tax=Piromyces finnis TaxID=1754191 RepID=A0A1Y1VGM6_9FUNG|nr:IF-2B-domain-containing protein [Piromyces finnis]|eukprot:ORX55885.1 IF-2B-domain-containing protein [Piromyces finnis]